MVSFLALASGFRAAREAKLLQAGELISRGALQDPTLFQLHQWIAGASVVLGVLALRALFRKREDHQGIGVMGLFLGMLWAGATLTAGYFGTLLGQPVASRASPTVSNTTSQIGPILVKSSLL